MRVDYTLETVMKCRPWMCYEKDNWLQKLDQFCFQNRGSFVVETEFGSVSHPQVDSKGRLGPTWDRAGSSPAGAKTIPNHQSDNPTRPTD